MQKKSIVLIPTPTAGDLASIKAELLKLLDGGVDSAVAICVGTSEGTRTPEGEKTAAWWGHTDPGNKARNQGSFSYQGVAGSPKEADLLQIEKLKCVLLPKYLETIGKLADIDLVVHQQLWVIACDCFTQSEVGATGEKGFLELIASNPFASDIALIRANSYIDPATQKLDAPGFNNSFERLYEDQKRRVECLNSVLNKLKQ